MARRFRWIVVAIMLGSACGAILWAQLPKVTNPLPTVSNPFGSGGSLDPTNLDPSKLDPTNKDSPFNPANLDPTNPSSVLHPSNISKVDWTKVSQNPAIAKTAPWSQISKSVDLAKAIKWKELNPSNIPWPDLEAANIPWPDLPEPTRIPWEKLDPNKIPWEKLQAASIPWERLPFKKLNDLSKIPWEKLDPNKIPWEKVQAANMPWERLPWEKLNDLSKIPWEKLDPNKIPWEKVQAANMPWEKLPWEQLKDLSKIPWEKLPDPNKIPWEKIDPTKVKWERFVPVNLPWRHPGIDIRDFPWEKLDPTQIPWEQVDPSRVNWSEISPSTRMINARKWVVGRVPKVDVDVPTIPDLSKKLAQGEKAVRERAADVEESVRTKAGQFAEAVKSQPWYKTVVSWLDSLRRILVIDATSDAVVDLNFSTGSYALQIDLIPGLELDEESVERFQKPTVQPIELAAQAFSQALFKLEISHNYEQIKAEQLAQHKPGDVFIVSRRFVEWFSLENAIDQVIAAIFAQQGDRAAAKTVKILRAEIDEIYAWLEGRGGQAAADLVTPDMVAALLSGNTDFPQATDIKLQRINIEHRFELRPVGYTKVAADLLKPIIKALGIKVPDKLVITLNSPGYPHR